MAISHNRLFCVFVCCSRFRRSVGRLVELRCWLYDDMAVAAAVVVVDTLLNDVTLCGFL